MSLVVIRLDPKLMKNPDADLRYRIPESLKLLSSGLIEDRGYDYENNTDAMHIYLKTSDIQTALMHIIALIEEDSDLKAAATISTSNDAIEKVSHFDVVYPSNVSGFIETVT